MNSGNSDLVGHNKPTGSNAPAGHYLPNRQHDEYVRNLILKYMTKNGT